VTRRLSLSKKAMASSSIAFAINAARSGLNEHHFNLDYSDNATCIHNLYVYTALRRFMAKLYWRIKKNGKWTWKAANFICIKHRYIDQMETTPCPECLSEE